MTGYPPCVNGGIPELRALRGCGPDGPVEEEGAQDQTIEPECHILGKKVREGWSYQETGQEPVDHISIQYRRTPGPIGSNMCVICPVEGIKLL